MVLQRLASGSSVVSFGATAGEYTTSHTVGEYDAMVSCHRDHKHSRLLGFSDSQQFLRQCRLQSYHRRRLYASHLLRAVGAGEDGGADLDDRGAVPTSVARTSVYKQACVIACWYIYG
jgi:hypothetical protein